MKIKLHYLFCTLLLLPVAAFSQLCVPQAGLGNAGIYPDSATNFSPAHQGSYYEQLISVKVPDDTTYLGNTIPISSIKLNSITGLPNGLSYGCVPADCDFPGNATSCAKIFGTTNDPVGTYPLTVTVTPYSIPGVPIQQFTFDYYRIIVNPPSSISALETNKFNVLQNQPNPSDGFTSIPFNLVSRSKISIKVVNAIGKTMYENEMNAPAGVGKFDLNTTYWSEGMYSYSIGCNGQVITRKFMVSH